MARLMKKRDEINNYFVLKRFKDRDNIIDKAPELINFTINVPIDFNPQEHIIFYKCEDRDAKYIVYAKLNKNEQYEIRFVYMSDNCGTEDYSDTSDLTGSYFLCEKFESLQHNYLNVHIDDINNFINVNAPTDVLEDMKNYSFRLKDFALYYKRLNFNQGIEIDNN